MNESPSSLPPELRDRLQTESDAERASLTALWNLLGVLSLPGDSAPSERVDVESAWQTVEQRTFAGPASGLRSARGSDAAPRASSGVGPSQTPDAGQPSDRPARSRRRNRNRASSRTSRMWMYGAACVLILAVVGLVMWWKQPVVVSAPAGAQITATLPDGSTVELNSGSSLQYRRAFQTWPGVDADRRTVTLDGEAYFSVTDHSHPFEVKTFNARVEVLGTEFNVRAREPEGRGTEVVVASGRVRVEPSSASPTTPARSVILDRPGQRGQITDDAETPTRIDVRRALAWRSQGFAVTDRPLSFVVDELERRYDIDIRLTPEARVRGGALTLYYARRADPETIIHDVCTARGLSYRATSRGFEIYVES